MSKTLEQVVLALPCDGATTLAIIGALKEAGLADATVYGLCETCGGSRKCKRCDGEGKWFYELELKMIPCDACNGTGACPDCTMVSVVTKELRERGICREMDMPSHINTEREARERVWGNAPSFDSAWDEAAERFDAVLSAVLRDVRVAKEVGVLERSGKGNALRLHARQQDGGASSVYPGDTIAIPEDDE